MDSLLYTLSETVHKQNYIMATYYTRLPREVNILKKVATLAVGQTIGTQIPIPRITEEIRERYVGKVANVFDVPSLGSAIQITEDQREYLIQIAYPFVDFGTDLPLLTTALLGNDASTLTQAKLLDIEFPEEFIRKLRGPQYGIGEMQNFARMNNRLVLLNIIRPCTGLAPKERAGIFYETAPGGTDFIKDDELFGNPVYSRPEERVGAYRETAKTAYEKTGERVKYFVNITNGAGEIIDNVKRAEEADTDELMISSAAMEYNMLKYMAKHAALPVLGHSVGAGTRFEGTMNRMTSPLAVGKLARPAGVDIVMINTPYGGYPLLHQKYMQTMAQFTFPFYDIKPFVPFIRGGVHPRVTEKYVREVGKDVVLATRGAVQGHPCGATARARTMRQTIDIVMNG